MKEIGKLIELLNEFEENRPMELTRQYRRKEMPTFIGGLVAISEYDDEMEDNSDLLVISKFNGFIKWLVENDKIDIVKVYENLTNYEIEIRIRAVKELLENNEEDTITYLKLLMILAIQDEPIRFLCEIIK